jgi:hypothetical protein
MTTHPDAQFAWQHYRALRRHYFWSSAAFPLLLPLTWVSIWVFGTYIPGAVAGVAWFAYALWSACRFMFWRCPRCGDLFGPAGLPPLNRRCRSCGLARWSDWVDAPPNEENAG